MCSITSNASYTLVGASFYRKEWGLMLDEIKGKSTYCWGNYDYQGGILSEPFIIYKWIEFLIFFDPMRKEGRKTCKSKRRGNEQEQEH